MDGRVSCAGDHDGADQCMGSLGGGREEDMPSLPEFSRAGLYASINPSPFSGMEVGGGWITACLGR